MEPQFIGRIVDEACQHPVEGLLRANFLAQLASVRDFFGINSEADGNEGAVRCARARHGRKGPIRRAAFDCQQAVQHEFTFLNRRQSGPI